MTQSLTLTATDGKSIYAEFTPAKSPRRGAVHVNHGMGEHLGRYAHVVTALTAAGYDVLAHDHRGHGQTAKLNGDPLGHMTAGGVTHSSWVEDMGVAKNKLKELAGAGPCALLGHSMGSFFAQRAVQMHPEWYDALILSGSTGRPTFKQKLSTYISGAEALIRGKQAPAKFFHELTFNEFNRPFKSDNHRQAWLSSDPAVWDAYAADPLCDFPVYTQAYVEVGRMITANFTDAGLANLNASMPTLMFGGTRDALSDMGPGLERLYKEWSDLGFDDLTLKFWEDGRHECMNEVNKVDVLAFMTNWLDSKFEPVI